VSPDAQTFEAHRDLMFAVAYRMLGTVTDAEDAVQDAWLGWSAAPRADVTDPRAYLTKVITNTSLNKLRAVRARREAYIGPWLPEPLLTSINPDIPVRIEVAESVSLAMLVVLESLTPEERAVFVLREVFAFSYAEIGSALGRTEVSARQLAHRAREHVQARRPRFPVDRGQEQEVTQRFLDAAAGGDIDRLIAVLAPDVTLTSDGGGKARAARRLVTGCAKVARLLHAIATRPQAGVDLSSLVPELAEINGRPGLLFLSSSDSGAGTGAGSGPGQGSAVGAMTWDISGGLVTGVQIIVNPDKLAALSARRTLPL
jgi:RNA polymerase sigma factor (sigma-70 family)